MNESVKHIKKHKKHKPDKKHNKKISKDTLASKFNALEEVTKQEKTDNIWPKATSSTELFSSPNIPDILVTPQKKDAINNQAAPPNAKRKFSGDKTSHDGEPIQENIDYTEGSEERRIRTKSLPQNTNYHPVTDFASAPLENILPEVKVTERQDLLKKKVSITTTIKTSLAPKGPTNHSEPLLLNTLISKLEGTTLPVKSIPTITISDPISIHTWQGIRPNQPVQVVDYDYVNSSPRKDTHKRSNSVSDAIPPVFITKEKEAAASSYLNNLCSSIKGKVNLPVKSTPIITMVDPISINTWQGVRPNQPVQLVDYDYVNSSPRKDTYKRSNSVSDATPPVFITKEKEEESGYLKNLYTSIKSKFHKHNKDPIHEDIALKANPQSNPEVNVKQKNTLPKPNIALPPKIPHAIKLSHEDIALKPAPEGNIKQKIILPKPNIAPPPKIPHAIKPNPLGHDTKVTVAKIKQSDVSVGPKFTKLPPQSVKQEKNLAPQKLAIPKVAIVNQNNSELAEVKKQLVAQQKQLDQMMGQSQKYTYTDTMPNRHSNKGSSLHTILQLVEATERKPVNFNSNLTGANDQHKEIHHHYIYDDDNNNDH